MISLLPSPPTPPSSPGSDPAWLMRPPIRTPPRKSRSAQEKLSRYKSLGVQNSKGLMKKKSMVNLRINTSTRIIANNEPTTPPSFRTPFPSPLKARTFPFSETLNRLLNEGVEDALSRRWGALSQHKPRELSGGGVDHPKKRMLLAVSSEVRHILSLRRLKGNAVKNESDLNLLIKGQCDAWIGRYLTLRAPLISVSARSPPDLQLVPKSAAYRPSKDDFPATEHLQTSQADMECDDVLRPIQGHLNILSIHDDDIWV